MKSSCRVQGQCQVLILEWLVLISAAKFNQLVYQYPIRIPERFSLVIRSLLTQEGICLTLQPDFKFLEVAYPYVAKRLLTDPNPALRERLLQVLFKDGLFQWKRLENLILLAREQVTMMNRNTPLKNSTKGSRYTWFLSLTRILMTSIVLCESQE
jgi:predicted unusual protein kinase regulating ubiquinone biosynthesis (AarF/ABC1/UbiB family)